MLIRTSVGAVIVACGGTTLAGTVCVPDDYATIQAALDAAIDGDEICVAPGQYDEVIDFLGKAVRLYATDGPEETVIDGGGTLDYAVVTCESGEGPASTLEGFTVTGGNGVRGGGMRIWDASPTVVECVFYSNANIGGRGLGMYIENGSPTILSCVFERNETIYGSGVGLHTENASPVIIDGVFRLNETITGSGGGLCSGGGDPRLVGCVFDGNSASFGGGASCGTARIVRCVFQSNASSGEWGSRGGGLEGAGSTMVIDSQFLGNSATSWGRPDTIGAGGGASGGCFVNCLFQGNHAGSEDEDGSYGGAVVGGTLVNCAVVGNRAASHGGGVSGGTLINCTVVGNFAPEGGGGLNGGTARNCVVWDNGADQIRAGAATYSCVQGGHEGEGNIRSNPRFADAPNGDVRLRPESPCIDAGANHLVPTDDFDVDDDGDHAERLPLDLDGAPRFADVATAEDTGCGAPVIVDMGAYEHAGAPVERMLVGDVDGSGRIDVPDLLAVLRDWGVCAVTCCLADVNGDRLVDVADLTNVLALWDG